MPTIDLPYIDAEIEKLDAGDRPPGYWRHFHWGLFDDPSRTDDSPDRYLAAAEAMTERIVGAGGVAGGSSVLDVGCGFGGTLDHIRWRHRGCRLLGVNIDLRQLQWGRRLVAEAAEEVAGLESAALDPIWFVTGDGCRLPVADGTVDHVLAVECVFHFPSRKAFFREAARVLRPGGTLALSDFLVAPDALATVAENVAEFWVGSWYGSSARPLTAAGYQRLARGTGFEPLVDEDVTERTLPTYPALRRIYGELGQTEAVASVAGVEALARAGGWEYHVLAFRR